MRPSAEFLETLGEYVYEYVDDYGQSLYVGKGKGDRCLYHLKNKGYKYEQCFIVARNLEKFRNGSLLLESYLIAKNAPTNNSVSGHYKECFVMTALSSLFEDFVDVQNDPFGNLPDWYVDNYDTFKGRIREFTMTAKYFCLGIKGRGNIYMSISSFHANDELKVDFEISRSVEADARERMQNGMLKFIEGANIDPDSITEDFTGAASHIYVTTTDLDRVLFMAREFWR